MIIGVGGADEGVIAEGGEELVAAAIADDCLVAVGAEKYFALCRADDCRVAKGEGLFERVPLLRANELEAVNVGERVHVAICGGDGDCAVCI